MLRCCSCGHQWLKGKIRQEYRRHHLCSSNTNNNKDVVRISSHIGLLRVFTFTCWGESIDQVTILTKKAYCNSATSSSFFSGGFLDTGAYSNAPFWTSRSTPIQACVPECRPTPARVNGLESMHSQGVQGMQVHIHLNLQIPDSALFAWKNTLLKHATD